MQAPPPQSDREYIQAIYYKVETIETDLKDLKDLRDRLRSLETFRDRVTFLAFPIWSLMIVIFGAWVKGLFG
jgi:hypothetical protein